MKTSRMFSLILVCLIIFLPLSSYAKQLFIAVITVDGTDTVKEGTNSIIKVTEFFDNTSLEDIFPDYTSNSSVLALVNFRGLGTVIEFEANSSELIFRIPGKDFEVRFDGETRDESQEQFEDWLKGEFNSAEAPRKSLTRLLQILVAVSPVDPVAGNPNSLMTRMVIDDFNQGITGPFISSKTPLPGQKNNFSIGGEVGFFNAGPYDGETFSIPISYKWNMKRFPKLSLIVDFPVFLTWRHWELVHSIDLLSGGV